MRRKVLTFFPIILFLIIPLFPLLTFTISKEYFLALMLPFIIYFIHKSICFFYGLIFGYKKYLIEREVDWFEKLKSSNCKIPEQVIVIPVYKEELEMLYRTIDSILQQKYFKELFHIVLTIEEREDFQDIQNSIYKKYSKVLGEKLAIYQHILTDNEVKGAASNRTFGSQKYVQQLLTKGINVDNYLITSPDADTVFDQQYFARVAYEWLNDENKHNRFYQTAVYKFSNNYWDVPIIIRALSSGLMLSILSTSTFDGTNRYTFSCFTLSLRTMIEINYWDVTIPVDDTLFQWRAFKALKGNWLCKAIYVPLSVDAVNSPNYFESHMKQYQQYYRWGWGIVAFPMAVESILDLKLSLKSKLLNLWKIFDVFIFVRIFPLITIIYLSIISLNNFPAELTNILNIIKNINFVLLLVIFYYQYKLIREDSNMKYYKLISSNLAEVFLGIINLLTFCMIPYIHAAFEMALGKLPDKKIKWSIKFISN